MLPIPYAAFTYKVNELNELIKVSNKTGKVLPLGKIPKKVQDAHDDWIDEQEGFTGDFTFTPVEMNNVKFIKEQKEVIIDNQNKIENKSISQRLESFTKQIIIRIKKFIVKIREALSFRNLSRKVDAHKSNEPVDNNLYQP